MINLWYNSQNVHVRSHPVHGTWGILQTNCIKELEKNYVSCVSCCDLNRYFLAFFLCVKLFWVISVLPAEDSSQHTLSLTQTCRNLSWFKQTLHEVICTSDICLLCPYFLNWRASVLLRVIACPGGCWMCPASNPVCSCFRLYSELAGVCAFPSLSQFCPILLLVF